MNNHALSLLIAKRAELAGIVVELEKELAQRRADLVHIDGALRLLGSDVDPATIPPKPRHRRARYFGRNELSRLCLDAFRRAAGEGITAQAITDGIMVAKGFERRDAHLRETVRVQVGAVLKRLHRRGVAEPSGKGRGTIWRLSGQS